MLSKIRPMAALAAAGTLALMTAGGAQAAAGWQQEPVPVQSGNLIALASVAPHVTWAAGFEAAPTGDGGQRLTPVVLSRDDRDGRGWQRVVTAGDAVRTRANAISAHGKDDVWVVGDNDSAGPVVHGAPIFTEHWDGRSWTRAQAPVPSDVQAANLLGVSTLSPHNAWAVGAMQVLRGNLISEESVIEHWDGKAWQSVEVPVGSAANYLNSISATGPDDVWAAGTLDRQALILHFDGRSWTQVPDLPAIAGGAEVSSVVANSPHDVWAVGNAGPATGPLVLHFDGRRWTQVAAPGAGEIFAAAKTSRGMAFIGYTRETGAPYSELFDGRTWTDLKLPALGVFDAPYAVLAGGGKLTVSGVYDTGDGGLHPLMASTSEG